MTECSGFAVADQDRHKGLVASEPGHPRHWWQGPGANITRIEDEIRETSDGETHMVKWMYSVYLNLEFLPFNTSVKEVRDRLIPALRHSDGWIRCGVWIRFVQNVEDSNATLFITSDSATAAPDNPDFPLAPGTSRVQRRDGYDRIYFRLGHLRSGECSRIADHEWGHGVFGYCDAYNNPQGYVGIMGNGPSGTPRPTTQDATDGRLYLRGEAPRIGGC